MNDLATAAQQSLVRAEEESPPSTGVVLWFNVGGRWYLALQMRFSREKRDFKVPFQIHCQILLV